VAPPPKNSHRIRRGAAVEEDNVTIVASDTAWPRLYLREATNIAEVFNSRIAEIEHFGSTAIPGLDAKPIIDILVGSDDGLPPSDRELNALAARNYVFLGEDGRRLGRWFWRKRRQIAFNLSLVPRNSVLWEQNLLLRDYLRAHPPEVKAYGRMKREAASAWPHSLLGYQNYKRSFMQELNARARAWRRP
jgi:GrpB-like predicted nucleotidyltransferase (UPF0157 family)